MIDITRLKQVYATLQQGGYNQDFDTFRKGFAGNENYANRKKVYDLLSANGAQIGKTYEEFMQNMQKPKSMGNPTVNKYRQQMFKSVDPTKNKASELTRKAVKTAHKAMDNVRKPVRGAVVNKQGKKVKEFDITPAKTIDDLNREYAQEVTSDWEKEQQRQSLYNTTRSLDEVQRKIAERDAQLDEADNGFWTGIRHAAQGMNVTGGIFQQYDDDMRKELIDPKYKQYLVEANYLTQMKKQLIQEEEDAAASNVTKWDKFKHASSSFTSGMLDEAFGSDAFDFGGYNKMRESDVLLRINDRINRGVATDDDRRLLQILKDKEEVESRLDNDAYSFGRGASQSAGFVTDFLITGGGDFGGLGRLGGKMALGLARKTFAKTMTKDLGKRFAAWSLKNLGKTLGEATGAAMTATSVQVGKTAANATQRYLGLDSDDGGLEYDKEGNLRFKGGTDVGTAIAKAVASGTIENYTELLGPHITSMGKRLFGWAGVGLEKITPDALSRFFDKVGSSELFKRIGTFTDEIANSKVLNAGKKSLAKVGVNDMPEEGLEEEAGIILNSLITGDNKFSDLWDKETQYKTWGGVMSMMGAMRAIPIARSAVGTAYSASKNKVEYFKCKHDLTKAETLARQALGDKWTPIKELIDNADNKHIIEVGVNIIRQSDKYSQEQAKAAQMYIGQLLKMRGFNNATMASIRDKNAKGEELTDADKKDIEVSNAYAEGHEAEGELRHLIQLEYEKRTANLAKRLGLTPEKIDAMNVDSFSSYIGLNSDADFDIFQYKKAKAAYDGVMDNAQNLVDIAGEVAAHRVDNMTNVHDGTIRKAFKKGTESNPDSPVYIISGNIELNDDGSINYTDSDKMIVVYDEKTGQREAIGNFMLASVDPNMQNAEEVKAQAIQAAKQKIITEQSNVIDGILAEDSEFTMEDKDGITHNYKIVQVDEQGNCIVSVDGTVLPEPLSLDAIQQQYDQSNVARSVKNDQTVQEPEQAQQEYQPIEDKFDYDKITNVNDGKVKSVKVTDEEGKNRFPNAKAVFLIQDRGAMPKFVVMDEEGNLTSYVGKRSDKIHLMGEKTVDEYKKQRQEELQMIAAENANSSMIEDNSGTIEADIGGIDVEDNTQPLSEADADNVIAQMESSAETAPDLELTPDNWTAEFGEDGTLSTPIGDVKMGENQVAKLFEKGRSKEFGMIKPTLTNPDVIIEVPSHSADGNEERSSSYLFIKTFLGKNGEKVYYFKSVTIKKDGLEISISSHYDRAKRVKEALMKGKLLYRKNDGAQTEQNQPSASVTTSQEDAAGSSESKDTNISSNGNENNESLTFEDGTPIPVDVNGEVDLSQTDAAHAAEWYDTNLGEDADGWLDGEINKAKKVLEQAKNRKLTGTKPSELVASKKEKEAAIADAQARYDSAISIRDSLKERRIAKEENTPEGRKNLIEKARRKFARLKSAVKDDAEAVSQLYKDVVGSLLHRLYDGTGIDVTDTIPLTAEEYVASNLGAHSLNYEGTETSKGVKQETGLSREDFAKTQILAADGKGTTIDDLVHSLLENRPSNLESLDTQNIRNALIGVLTSGFKASEARNYIENLRIAQAENILEEQKKAADNAVFAEEQKVNQEEEEKKSEENEKINEQTNENINTPELSHEQQKAKEDGEKLGFPAVDNEGEPINEYVVELAKWAKKQGLEIDPTSKLNSYADLFLMCKDGFGVSTLVPDEGENINQVVYFPDNVKDFDQLWKLQEEFNAERDLKHSSNIDSEITEGATFYDADTAREFKEFVDKKVDEQNKVFGEQRPEEDLPFSARKNGKQQTEAERAADVEKNKVDDIGLVDAVIGEKIRKSFERIAKMMGAKVQYQRTDKLGNGWIQETTDADGNVHRTIFITLDSSITEGAQFIFGHEMTHQIKNLNPAAYNELTQLVLDTYGSDAFDKAVDKTMQRYSDAGFSGRARDYYAEEVVADAVGEMIRDLNLAHTLAMKMSHPLLAAIHKILQKIKMAFFGTEYSGVTKNIIRSIEQAYVKTANGQVTNTETGEDVSFSLRLKSAIEETETNPSDAQKESGNYKKGHIKFGGYDYTIENPKGSTRSGKDADGKEWKVTMHDTYGYIRGKFGKDGDHLDMFINDKADLDNWNGDVFVVDQVNPDGSFDEHKVMYGYDSMDDAKKAYLANYSDGWQGLGNITGASKDEFDKWLDTSNRKLKPFADYAKVKFSLKDEKIKSIAEKFRVNEDDVAMYANAVERGSTAEAARARANIKRYLLQANEDKISSFKDIIKYTKPINEALKENFGDLDAMIEQRRKQVEAQRNAMEAARKRAQKEEEKRQKHLDELSLIPTDELDKRYMDAIANNDESTAREMLDESARRNGYGDVDSDYQGQGAWAAPSNPQYESDEARRADIENSPDVNLEDIALGYNLQPDDYFDNPRAYMNNTAYGLESAHVIKNALDAIKNGEKDVKVKVYRAVPTSVKEGKLRNGDWVTPSKKYAEMHGDNRLDGKYRIIEDEVPANQLWWDGNDVNEFGFDDGKEYRYKNAKNNRKLNDLITYDNKGNMIPPSKRFNSRKSDIRFSLAGERGAADMAEDLKSLNTPDEVDDAIKTAIDDMPSGWQMANKKMIHIAQALGENRKAEIAGEEPKFSLKNGTLIKAGTYFSGGGLVEEGLKGIIDPVVAVEYDEKISGVYRNNFGQHIVTADVRDVDPKELVKQIDGEVEYFHASPVCKNYSQAKSNHAEVELDKETAASTAEFINAVKPKVVTIENVKGYKDSEAMKIITDALDANGYTWDADVYNAADYGGYTNRERLIVRAVRDGKLPEKPKKMEHKSGWYEAVADIIPTLTEKKNGVAPWMDIRLKADGIDWRNIDKPLYVMGSAYADGKVPHAFADELLPTLRTKSGDVIVMPDGKVYRAMGRVLARVSGVSDDYKMPFSENLSHTIIGNGIPTQLTEHVIAPLLTGSDPKFSIRTYHGTGASFDKFDLSHALEGEGSESFGHGVYVTNSSKIGREYAQRAKNRKMEDLYKNMRYPDGVKGDIFKRRVFGEMVNDVATGGSVASAKEFAKKRIGADANDIQRTLENLKDREKGTEYEQNLKNRLAEYKEGLKWIDSLDEDYLTQGNANRYDVEIPDDNGSNYLDWEGTIPDSLDKQKVAEDAYKVVSDNQGFNDFKATPLNDFIAHTLKTYVNTTDVAGRVEKLKSDIKDVIENYVADDDVLALNEYLKDATPDDVLATIWYNDLVRDIKDADLGEELYRKLSTYVGDNAASQILSDNGLVGIKYPAGMIHGGAKEGDYNYVIFDENNANIVGNTRFSLRGSTPYDKQMEEWMEKNHLEKGAVPMEKPIMKEGENIFDYANRMVEWTRNQNLWKTAPKKTGFQDALDKWKADNGLSPDAYPPVRPHRENYSTEIGYAEDLEEYNKKKEIWKSAPKPKDFDLSVDLEDMNKQLRNIRRAVLNQKNYDQRTVKAVSDLVRKMLNIGWGDGLSRGKVGNLLSAAKNATGANDVKKYLDKAMGILAENYLNRLSTAYDNLINTRGARADQSGVIKMGSLDAKGQAFMSEYKKAMNMDDSSLNTYIANIEEDSAKNEDNVEMNDYRLAGIQAAIMYKQQIGGNDADIAELKRQIGELKNKKDATKEDKDLLKSLEKKLFENKFDRITMYENLLNNIQRMVKESKGRAKEFREEIAEHKNEILHRANLDLEGMDSAYYDTTTAKKKFVNNVFQRAAFSSTYTFEQFLRFFGKHSANGEGRLYNYFHKLNQDALDEEQLYNEMNRNALDEKTKELFGKEKFMKLVGIDGKGMKEMDVDFTDYSNKETGKRTIHLKQGQMLYIYLVNKETDGEMKLRAMGITEEKVAEIEKNLDPRVKAMGEWLQDEYLPECQRRYQSTHTKYFGAPMKEIENYFPLAINNRARNVREDVNQDSDAMSRLAGTSTGAIITRRVNVIPLDIENVDAFEVAFNHLQEMEEWSAMQPFRQDINTLLSYTHFRNQVQNMSSVAYGSGRILWDEFMQTAQIAAGTYKPKVKAGMMDSRIAAAMGGVAVAKISGRLWTAIKQSQSATVFLPECDFTRFVKNGVNPYGSWKWAMENIPDFRKRVENMTYGDVKLRQYLDELEKWHDWTKTISKIGMAPNILVDGITCAVGARSVYETEVNRLTKLGYPKEKAEEKAYYKAVAAYNKTQQSSGGMYLSPMQVDRTYVSAALSLFKNANFAYGRMQIEACRGLARTYDFWGGKHKTTLIESMTRQIMEEDGLDENTARAIAKATYNRTFRQSIGRLINFATLVPVSWALYKVLPYLLTGDDDDKKNDMIEEAVLKGFATSLSDNYVIPFASNILNAGLKVEDGKPTFDPEVFRYQNLYINPATSDLANIYSMIGNQKWYSVANKLGMLGVQSLIGFNPETVGALYQAFAEADYDNGNVAKEWQIGILKAISAPEESIRELYMDELGLKSGDIKKIPLAELEKRYAERQINRDNLLSQIGMDAETFNGYVEKYQKSFEKKIKDKMDKWDEYDKKKADEFFDTTSDPKLKDMIAKKRANDANAAADEQIAKEGLNQEKNGKESSEEAYDAVKMSIDVAEDNAISTYNKVLNKRYAALNDEYNNQTDAMKFVFMSKHPNFKAYKYLESEYTTYGKKMKELKEKLVSADGYDAKQTILKQIRAERDKFYELQSKVR